MFKSLLFKSIVLLVLIIGLFALANPVQAASPVVKDGECFSVENTTWCWSTQLVTSPSGSQSFIERSSVTYITESGREVTERNFAHSVFDKDGNLIVAIEKTHE